MDLATVIGLVLGTVLVLFAILLGGSIALFLDLVSVLIVLGGGISATVIRFGMKDITNAMKVAKNAFSDKTPSVGELIDKLEELATIARKEGILALERVTFDDPFLQKGVNYLVDGADSEQLQSLLYTDIDNTAARHELGSKIFSSLGDAAPAFGMIGTLVGLVQMLANMDDPASIGPAMAVALLTTLYGSLIANLIALPIADKLSYRSAKEVMRKNLMIEGLLGIQKGENPKILREFLETYMPPSDRKKE
ncbi:MotA/TolQ/ExbB proton channel family protein [bacterium]|nr:MotA/TolQ/ExbB proton channel family protein [bacterium]